MIKLIPTFKETNILVFVFICWMLNDKVPLHTKSDEDGLYLRLVE